MLDSLLNSVFLSCFKSTGLVPGDQDADQNTDNKLTDFSSAMVMERNGWKLNIKYSMTSAYSRQCGMDTWFGYNYGRSVGSVQTTFQGTGKAVLNFGNCYQSGRVIVYLNGKEISRAHGNTLRKEVEFQYSKGDLLRIEEVHVAIIKINSLGLYHNGTT